MNILRLQNDLVKSAAGAKAHFDILWAQISDAKPMFLDVMNQHADFFLASQDAHFIASFICLAHLYDKRADSSSIQNYLQLIKDSTDAEKFQRLETQYNLLAIRAKPLLDVRHKTVAHIDIRSSEEEVFSELKLTWREIRNVIYESVQLVEILANSSHTGALGMPRDGRLGEATLNLLHALNKKATE